MDLGITCVVENAQEAWAYVLSGLFHYFSLNLLPSAGKDEHKV